jgi:hypothetical protein
MNRLFEWMGLGEDIDPGLQPQHPVEISKTTAFAYPLAGSGTTPPIFPAGSAQPNPAYSGTFIPSL